MIARVSWLVAVAYVAAIFACPTSCPVAGAAGALARGSIVASLVWAGLLSTDAATHLTLL